MFYDMLRMSKPFGTLASSLLWKGAHGAGLRLSSTCVVGAPIVLTPVIRPSVELRARCQNSWWELRRILRRPSSHLLSIDARFCIVQSVHSCFGATA